MVCALLILDHKLYKLKYYSLGFMAKGMKFIRFKSQTLQSSFLDSVRVPYGKLSFAGNYLTSTILFYFFKLIDAVLVTSVPQARLSPTPHLLVLKEDT